MNYQHKGAEMQALGQFETNYRTQPGAPSALVLPFISCGLARDLRRTDDPSVDNSPLPSKSGCGDAIVPPAQLQAAFDARTVGWWLKAVMGQPMVKKPVMVQPSNVTGVTVHYAGSACAAGNGTLTFTAVGTTLTWTPSGGAAGAAVNVGAGGRFTLPNAAANSELVITVDAASLPVANQIDANVTVHATLKAHVFPWSLDDRPSALFEIGHMKSAQQEFYRYLGLIAQKLSYKGSDREQNVSITAFAAEERSADTVPAVVTAWDPAPTRYDRARFCGSGGQITNGVSSSALGAIVEWDLELDNQATGLELADGLEGYGHADNGEMVCGGKIKLVFRGQNAGNIWTLARSSTSTRLRVSSKVVIDGDVFSLTHDFPSVEFTPDPLEKSGKTGLMVTVGWKAHRNVGGVLPITVLVNDVPSF